MNSKKSRANTFAILILQIMLLCVSSKTYAQANTWQSKQSFGGTPRSLAVGFSIGTKGYIGTGYDGTSTKDFWEYDPATDTWAQKADFGGGPRVAAVGFGIGNKGYIGTGSTNSGNDETKDLWEYDPATNVWTRKADLTGPARLVAIGFSIGNKGYIGTGRTAGYSLFQDFWEYDPGADVWTQKADFAGGARYAASAFSICTKGYIGTGTDFTGEGGNYTFRKDFWEYNQSSNTWTRKADFGGSGRELAVGFSIYNKGYIGTGYGNADFWEYDISLDTWTQKADFGGGDRNMACGFSVGGKGYITTGSTYNPFPNVLWAYIPDNTSMVSCSTPTVACSNNNSVLYYGYTGDQTVTITGTPSGGTAPYSVSITMDRPLKCNVITSSGNEIWTSGPGTTSTSNTICPASGVAPISTANGVAQGGSYSINATLMADAVFTITVTDALGYSATCTTKVHAEDVRCFAGNSGNEKITLCHKTGNDKNPCITICVDQSALQEHLNHGDFVGNCTTNCVAPPVSLATTRTQGQITGETKAATPFGAKVLSNPSRNRFTLKIETDNSKDAINVRVMDLLGKVIEVRTNVFGGQLLLIGNNYKPGVYFAEVTQGTNKKLLKLVKL